MPHFRPARPLTAILATLMLIGCSTEMPANQGSLPESNDVDAINVIIDEPENAALPAADASTLTPAGLGDMRIGMTRAELVAAVGGSPAASADPEACEEFHPSGAPQGVLVMLERGRLTRISLIRDATIKTGTGLGIGATAGQVKAAYGPRATATAHKYVEPPAEYITAWTSGNGRPDSRGILYEVGKDGKVMAIRAGGPAIQYVEGCS